MYISLAILIYALSVLKMYTYMRNSFGPDGQWQHSTADGMAVFFTLMPGLNTVISLFELFTSGKKKPSKSFNKFFGL